MGPKKGRSNTTRKGEKTQTNKSCQNDRIEGGDNRQVWEGCSGDWLILEKMPSKTFIVKEENYCLDINPVDK